MALKVIVIGSGAREHAIAHTLLKGESVESVYCIPGNPGMEKDGIITSEEMHLAWLNIAGHYEPPFLEVEDLTGNIGDGVTVDDR